MIRSIRRVVVSALWVLPALWALPTSALSYPGGTPNYVADVAPFCAGCHASVSIDQFEGVSEQRASAELAANKHIARIQAAPQGAPYAALTPAQRQVLIEAIQEIDSNSSVQVFAPQSVNSGQVLEVTVEAKGGGGPVVGIALVDSNQRWQSSPAPSRGWQIVEKPMVTGPDGQPQTGYTDRRNPNLAPGISYVNISGVKADPAQNKYDTVSVTYRLRAPARPGTYRLAAAFFYGTEKAAPNGAVETINGILPLGGGAASSGRVLFSEVLPIQVK